MIKKLQPDVWITTLAAIVFFVAAQNANAMTANQYFSDGNRLFRDDLYWAALLRYGQAADQGLDTPVLHYNLGIAHYRAGQHIRARDALLRALEDPLLRVAAHYNLGLNAYELGQIEAAGANRFPAIVLANGLTAAVARGGNRPGLTLRSGRNCWRS